MIGILTGTNTPMPTPTMTVDPNLVSPGPVGFVAIAVLAIVVVFLVWDLLRRIRRVRYRAEVSAALDAEMVENDAQDGREDS